MAPIQIRTTRSTVSPFLIQRFRRFRGGVFACRTTRRILPWLAGLMLVASLTPLTGQGLLSGIPEGAASTGLLAIPLCSYPPHRYGLRNPPIQPEDTAAVVEHRPWAVDLQSSTRKSPRRGIGPAEFPGARTRPNIDSCRPGRAIELSPPTAGSDDHLTFHQANRPPPPPC